MSNDASKSLATKYKIATPSHLDAKRTILVVEDQTDLRLIVSHQIQKLQLGVLKQAANGYEAVEITKAHEGPKIQAFVVDWDMPVMNGLEFLAELQENPDLDRAPFCLTMEQVSKERLMLAVESGVDEILVKPFTLGDIGPKLRSAFQKYHNPSNPERVYELAKQMLRDGKLVESTKIYRELGEAAPKAARPLVGMARNAIKQKDYDQALKLLADAEARNKNFVHLYAERAGVYASQEKWDEAVVEFKKAITLSPLNALRYKAAADILFKCRRYDDSVELLETALKHKLEFPDLYHYLSQAKFALRDFKSAAKYIRQALSFDAQNVTYLNQLGICLKDQEQFDDATKVYNQIIKLDPTNVAALYNKAILSKSKGSLDEAIKLLERAVQKDPDFNEARAKLADYQKEKASGAA